MHDRAFAGAGHACYDNELHNISFFMCRLQIFVSFPQCISINTIVLQNGEFCKVVDRILSNNKKHSKKIENKKAGLKIFQPHTGKMNEYIDAYSTVTDLARLRGLSISQPFKLAT